MLRNIFFHKNMVGENSPPSRFLKEKRRSAKSDVSKVLFPDIGKITNRFWWCTCTCSPWLLFIKYGPDMRKIRHESSGDVTSYRMEQGLSDGTGYINCYLPCWKFNCQLHFGNTCTSSDSLQEVVNICSEN